MKKINPDWPSAPPQSLQVIQKRIVPVANKLNMNTELKP